MFKVGDYAWDKVTNSVVLVEYVDENIVRKKYLVRNHNIGGFRLDNQLLHSTVDFDGKALPTTNEA
jgi:hypothetical protein